MAEIRELTETIEGLERIIDRLTLIDREFGVCVLRRAIALLKPTDTQADLMERARPVVEKWFGRPGGYDHPMLPDVAAALQSEREHAAAEARRHLQAMLDLYSEINDNPANAAFWEPRARAAQLFLASPAPQEETR